MIMAQASDKETESKVRRGSKRWVRHVTRRTTLIIIVAVGSVIVGVVLSIMLRDIAWFARSGAVVSTLGVLLVSQSALLAETMRSEAVHPASGRSQIDPEHYEETGQRVPDWVERDVKVRYAVTVLGPALSAIGTLIWAFADLIPLK
jgi:hypothetical protein